MIELILMAHAVVQPAPLPTDACAALIPPALSARINSEMPGYALPLSGDAGDNRTRDIANRGALPCPFVVAGDFDGDGALDRALLVKSTQGIKLIVMLNHDGQWQLSLNEDWPMPLIDSELEPKEPGLYQRNDAIDHPVAQLDQLPSIQAENSGFAIAKIHGHRVIYFLINDHWQKLTIKDN